MKPGYLPADGTTRQALLTRRTVRGMAEAHGRDSYANSVEIGCGEFYHFSVDPRRGASQARAALIKPLFAECIEQLTIVPFLQYDFQLLQWNRSRTRFQPQPVADGVVWRMVVSWVPQLGMDLGQRIFHHFPSLLFTLIAQCFERHLVSPARWFRANHNLTESASVRKPQNTLVLESS